MSTDIKSYREKLKLRYLNKKRQASIISTSNNSSPNIVTKQKNEVKKKVEGVQKISEKYLKEEKEVENLLKVRQIDINEDSENIKKNQRDISFFCDQYPTISDESEELVLAPNENGDNHSSPKSDSHSSKSTHSQLASTYIQPDTEEVIEKYQVSKMIYDEGDLLFNPNQTELDLNKLQDTLRNPENEGICDLNKPSVDKSNELAMIKRLVEDGSSHMIDETGGLKSMRQYTDFTLYRIRCDKEFIPIYVPPTSMLSMKPKIIFEKKFLKIFVSHLNFNHHPLFSNEHVVAKSLEKLYEQHIVRISENVTHKLRTKLKMLRQQKTVTSNDDDDKSGKILRNEDILLNNQIKNVRQKLYKEEKYDRDLLKNILETWKSLKNIRKQQGYTLTKLGMKIQKFDVDLETDKNEWQMNYDTELNEMVEEEFGHYQIHKQKYKEYLRKLREAEDTHIDTIEVIKKPKKPDIDKIVQVLNEIYEKAKKPLGEPEVVVNLVKSDVVQNDARMKWKKLLKKIQANSYFVRLVIDDEIIGSTKYCPLNENFHVEINSAFIIKLTKKIPEIMKLIVFEQHNKVNKKIAEVIVPLPDDEEFFSETELTNFEFSSKRLMTKLNNGKKAGKKIISINGKICINCGWTSEDSEKDDEFVIKDDTDKKRFQLNHEKLKVWYEDNLLNPMDPDTGTLLKIINCKEEIHEKVEDPKQPMKPEKFRFNEEDLAFCSEEEFNNNERFNLLIARYRNELHYKNKKFVPQFEREIELEKDRDTKIIDESIGMDPIDLQRHRGRKYLKRVYEIITNHCENLNRDKLNTNILIGDHYPIGTLSLAFLDLFGPKRPLKPTRRTTSSRASCKISEIHNFNIVITVVRAFGVPVRNDEPQQTHRKGSNMSITKFTNLKSVNVRPYVTISLKDQAVRTTTAEGTNPCWNEQLRLPLNTNSDQMKKFLTIDLFDEVVEDLIDNVNEVYQRISSKWLGELKIPISTICTNQRIEGTFEIQTPQILMGYSKPKFSPVDHTSIFIENLPDMTKRTNISVFISLEPYIEIPDLISTGLECIEIDIIETHIKLWYEQMKIDFPQRAKNPLITLLNGKRACITRLVSPINIPFEKNENAEYLIRRFVSLIPLYHETSNNNCSKLNGVWLSNNHILSLLSASSKDLGVLLTCYYLELGYEAWLVLGNSLHAGESCFVLVKEQTEFYLIDPTSGRRYSCKDIYCPLTFCYCLINQHNLWANVQNETRVFMTKFDVNKSLDWRPLFSKKADIPNTSIHETNFTYEHSYDTNDLQKMIQAKIIKKINSWRSHRKTVWNRFIGESLRNVLMKMEEDVCLENESIDSIELLHSLFSNYKVTGFTLNMKYTNLSAIVSEVKNTGIHLNVDNKVEFAVSVYIKEYANNVLSIWIFLLSLIPAI